MTKDIEVKKIVFLTGTRADYGKLKSLISISDLEILGIYGLQILQIVSLFLTLK